ncbi:hypothetical protein ACFE04_006898 [Oxalis oulophora]
MVETSNHQPPPPPGHVVAPPPGPQSLAFSRGPTWTPAEQLLQLQYCIHSNPSWPEALLLAFQHYIVMLGTTVLIATTLVPQMGGDNGDKAQVIQTLLFMAGINTLIQTLIGSRLPTVMRPSFAFIVPVGSIIMDLSDETFDDDHDRFTHTMRIIQGSLIVSSFINMFLGFSQVWGNLARKFSPIIIVPVVILVGLGLFERGFPLLANCVQIGAPMLVLLVIFQQYLKRVHARAHVILERFALLLCIAIVWAFAAILTVAGAYNSAAPKTQQSCRTDRSYLLSSASWVKVPYPFQWGTPIFRASHVFGMMGATLVSAAEARRASLPLPLPHHQVPLLFHAPHVLTDAALAHLVPPQQPVVVMWVPLVWLSLRRLVQQRPAPPEFLPQQSNVDPGLQRVVQISTGFMLFFSIFGKFGAFFASIPLPIFGAIYCVLLGIVAATGITFIQFANSNSMRNIYVLGISLFLGISISQYFNESTAADGYGRFNDILNSIFASAPTVAIIVGTILDNTLEARYAVEDRGLPWWKPFMHRKGDIRNDEFYSLPLRINEYIPTRFL